MKLSELMTNHTPNADFEGYAINDDFEIGRASCRERV